MSYSYQQLPPDDEDEKNWDFNPQSQEQESRNWRIVCVAKVIFMLSVINWFPVIRIFHHYFPEAHEIYYIAACIDCYIIMVSPLSDEVQWIMGQELLNTVAIFTLRDSPIRTSPYTNGLGRTWKGFFKAFAAFSLMLVGSIGVMCYQQSCGRLNNISWTFLFMSFWCFLISISMPNSVKRDMRREITGVYITLGLV